MGPLPQKSFINWDSVPWGCCSWRLALPKASAEASEAEREKTHHAVQLWHLGLLETSTCPGALFGALTLGVLV